MLLNLYVLKEDLAAWNPRGELSGSHLKACLAYPLVCDEFPAKVTPEALYLVESKCLPATPPRACPSLICVGEPPEAWADKKAPLLWVDGSSNVHALLNDVVAIFWKYEQWDRHLRRLIDEGEPLSRLADPCKPLFNNPIGALGTSFRYIFGAYPDVETDNAYFKHDKSSMLTDGAFLNSIDAAKVISDEGFMGTIDSTGPYRYHSTNYDCTMLTCNVNIDGEACALVVTNDYIKPLTPRDDLLVEHLADFLSRHLDPSSIYELTHPQYVIDTLKRLFSHDLVPERSIERLLEFYGWGIRDRFVVLDLHERNTGFRSKAIEPCVISIERMTLNDCCYIEDGYATFIFDLTAMGVSSDGIADILWEHLGQLPIDAFMSAEFDDFRNVYYYQQQARNAGQAGMRKNPAKPIHFFEDNALDYLLDSCVQGSVVETLVPAGLARLIEQDLAEGTDYVHLLRVFLDNDRNAVQTAKELFIHRNTLSYRLGRLKELSQLDLDDPDVRLRIGIALRLIERKGV